MSINTGDKLKIWFADMWPLFQYDNNYFYHLLNTEYDVELDEDNPDIMFYSCDPYRDQQRKYHTSKIAKRVFYTMEGIPPKLDSETTYPPEITITSKIGNTTTYMDPLSDLTGDSEDSNRPCYYYEKCDFALTHDVLSDSRHKRFPYWAYHIDWFNQSSYSDPDLLVSEADIANNNYRNTAKTKFCVTFFNNPVSNRLQTYQKLNEYKEVDGYGDYFDNGFFPWEEKKLEILKNYKFCICFENKVREGYHTEKLYHAKLAGAIPIYWGHASASNDFNPNCFLNLNDFDSVDALVERVKEIDSDDSLYQQYVSEPLFSGGSVPDEFKPSSVLSFFKDTVLA